MGLALHIDLGAREPVYQQIIRSLRTLLVSGELAPGRVLPTVREVALELGVHHNTVAQAYRALADEGWLDLRRRRGALVLDRDRPAPAADVEPGFQRRFRELAAEAQAAGMPARAIAQALRGLAEDVVKKRRVGWQSSS
jgi:GntR family transcriptional regulator